MIDKDLKVTVWWNNHGNLIRRDSLSSDHPESYYGKIKGMGLNPEEYGIYKNDISIEAKAIESFIVQGNRLIADKERLENKVKILQADIKFLISLVECGDIDDSEDLKEFEEIKKRNSNG